MRRALWSCSLGKKHSLIIARIYPNLDQSSGLLEAQEQEPNLYKDWKIFRSSSRSAFLIVGIGHYQAWIYFVWNPIHQMRCILKFIWTWKLFSPIHPLWDFDPEVVSCGAGGIIWCLIKTGSMSSPTHTNIVFKSRLPRLSHGSNLTHDTYTLHRSDIKLLQLLIASYSQTSASQSIVVFKSQKYW